MLSCPSSLIRQCIVVASSMFTWKSIFTFCSGKAMGLVSVVSEKSVKVTRLLSWSSTTRGESFITYVRFVLPFMFSRPRMSRLFRVPCMRPKRST